MQNSTKLNKKISENTNESNYNNRTIWKKMISEHEMSITSFMTKLDQKLFMTKQKNRMRIISTNLKQKWLMISETWQFTLNDLLWEWLHYSSIRKREEILSENIKKLQRKEKNKISNLKCWKSKDISSNKWVFKKIW